MQSVQVLEEIVQVLHSLSCKHSGGNTFSNCDSEPRKSMKDVTGAAPLAINVLVVSRMMNLTVLCETSLSSPSNKLCTDLDTDGVNPEEHGQVVVSRSGQL